MLIRPAQKDDLAAIESIVERAYGVYVERIGMRPGPMDADYAEQIRRDLIQVAELEDDEGAGDVVAGLIVLVETGDRLTIENVAVDPDRQGRGIGGRLLDFAEGQARRAGIDTVALFTHEKMTENIALYAELGYTEDERREERGFARVFMSKTLS